MNPANTHLKTAIDTVQCAIDLDRQQKYSEALEKYITAIEWFTLYLKYEKSPNVTERIEKRVMSYVKRAEEIKNQTLCAPAVEEDGGDSTNGAEPFTPIKTNVKWDDIAGLETAKSTLKEAVVMPIRFKRAFEERQIETWRGILLYGPPGTGKSHLAKAVACEANAPFFSVTAADLLSKWVGDSEKRVRQLFETARACESAVIFIDEIESLCSSRSNDSGNGGHASERVKTEFLTQMDGVGTDQSGLLVLGATNLPWTLDMAIRRRFEKRIYIALPDQNARQRMFELGARKPGCTLSAKECRKLARVTEGYSGADIAIVVREATMRPVRLLQDATHFKPVGERMMPCSPGDADAQELTWDQVDTVELTPVTHRDFLRSVQATQPSVGNAELAQYDQWTEQFGVAGNH